MLDIAKETLKEGHSRLAKTEIAGGRMGRARRVKPIAPVAPSRRVDQNGV